MKVAVLVVAVALLLARPSAAYAKYQGKPSLMMEKDKMVKNNANILSSKRRDQAQDTTDYRVMLMLGKDKMVQDHAEILSKKYGIQSKLQWDTTDFDALRNYDISDLWSQLGSVHMYIIARGWEDRDGALVKLGEFGPEALGKILRYLLGGATGKVQRISLLSVSDKPYKGRYQQELLKYTNGNIQMEISNTGTGTNEDGKRKMVPKPLKYNQDLKEKEMNVDSDAVCTSDTTKCADSPVVHEKIIRARKGSEKSGRFMMVLSMDIKPEEFKALVTRIKKNYSGDVYGTIDGTIIKLINAYLSEDYLLNVSYACITL